ncbi:hypothetical protein CONPUDRAFT_157320 [Coniophora puteana RWD-64-598 SS2]|uniref:Uncharacterized protein n=1 Tax=Coniophora puteana (strain RWD-64-598) TaxID=741705 RepID=A0A5M3MCV5_CONPW|nr:uncharacterized protein CONPUDRAFT_157320 [Coniophora puteana RWD-64-598 SS2]EIW77048.1 hypothetical protein CONPUDRAFT_157320 [Coniophora puteana RWD-64-598 SS2]
MVSVSPADMEELLYAPEPHRSQNLRGLFTRMADPNEDPVFVVKYALEINQELRRRLHGASAAGFSTFGIACLNAGIVRAMIALANKEWPELDPRLDQWVFIAQYNGIEALSILLNAGDIPQRRGLLDSMLQEGVVDLCMRLIRHRLCLMRRLGINTLQCLASESMLGEKVSPSTAANIIEAVCLYALNGPSDFVFQLNDPATEWQAKLFFIDDRTPISEAKRHARRYHSITQESALWIAHGLLCTFSGHSRQFCSDMIKRKPQILDLLLNCAIIERSASHPESDASATACEVLALLFHLPCYVVPGVDISPPRDREYKDPSWKETLRAMAILTSRPDWLEKLIKVWTRIQEEDTQIFQNVVATSAHAYAAFGQKTESYMVFENRGTSRVVVLRFIALLTHAADLCSIATPQIESLLAIAYLGCRKTQPSQGLFTRDGPSIENHKEVYRLPMWSLDTPRLAEASVTVAPEHIMGPTAIIRLLAVLAQRKALSAIQTLTEAPKELSPSASFSQIQQITHPDVIRRIIEISHKRLRVRLDHGRGSAKGTHACDHQYAREAFAQAAELAAALVALDTHTEGAYMAEIRGARKQLVIALGNAAQMALNLEQWGKAIHFAWGASNVSQNIPPGEELSQDIIKKNKRRIDQANTGLRAEGVPFA